VRREERVGGKIQEIRLTIRAALQDLALPEDRIAQVISALITDDFQVLTEEELMALNLENLSSELREALEADRIDDLLAHADLVRAVDLDRIEALGDDGQLLAGATLAALCDPSEVSYRWINRRLAYALIRSYHHDEKLGFAAMHMMLDDATLSPSFASLPPHESDHDALEQAADIGVAAKPTSAEPRPRPNPRRPHPGKARETAGAGESAGEVPPSSPAGLTRDRRPSRTRPASGASPATDPRSLPADFAHTDLLNTVHETWKRGGFGPTQRRGRSGESAGRPGPATDEHVGSRRRQRRALLSADPRLLRCPIPWCSETMLRSHARREL
jgi:hypothetical protein